VTVSKPELKARLVSALETDIDEPLSNVAVRFKLRRCNTVVSLRMEVDATVWDTDLHGRAIAGRGCPRGGVEWGEGGGTLSSSCPSHSPHPMVHG